MAEKNTEQKGQKTFEQLEKEAQERGTNVVLGAKSDAPVIDNQEESGATGTGKGGKGRSGQEDYEDAGGALEGGVTNFFKQ